MLIEMENIKKTYGNFDLLCSLSLKKGMITGIVGENGAGKSTLFKILLGLTPFDSGSLRILGSEKKSGDENQVDKSRIGTVLADSGFGGHMTVKQIASVLNAAYEETDARKFLETCSTWGLPVNKKIKEFSTGMNARLKVLTAVSHGADLLLLDEPTTGLDVIAREEILDMLRGYMEEEGRGILISSHISSDLEGLCDDIYVIHNGRILFHEDTDVILSDYGVLKIEEEMYESIARGPVLCVKKESYGYCCLTNQRTFYEENYPSIVVERCGIDEIETMLIRGDMK